MPMPIVSYLVDYNIYNHHYYYHHIQSYLVLFDQIQYHQYMMVENEYFLQNQMNQNHHLHQNQIDQIHEQYLLK